VPVTARLCRLHDVAIASRVGSPQDEAWSLELVTTCWPQRASNPCLVAVTFSPAVPQTSRHDALRKADATKTRSIDAPQADGWLKAPARNCLLANRSLQFSFESVI